MNNDIVKDVIEGKWTNLQTLLDFINENLMTVNPKFVIDNFDFKYVDIRIDMRTGHAILSRGTKKMELLDAIKDSQKEIKHHINRLVEFIKKNREQAEKITKLEAVVEAAKELNDLEEARLKGEYEFDSFTFQPLRIALSELEGE